MNESIHDPKSAGEFLGGWQSVVDPEVHRTTLAFHERSCWVRSHRISAAFPEVLNEIHLTDTEFSQSRLLPMYSRSVSLSGSEDCAHPDAGSADFFYPVTDLSFAIARDFLTRSFCAYRGGVRHHHRPYPSAGGLYPVEVFLVHFGPDSGELKRGVYHLLPNSHLLGSWPVTPSTGVDALALPTGWGLPVFAVVYVINLAKAIFKYRYRGYRHALIEVGSMLQQAGIAAREVGWGTRCWSGFCDHHLASVLNLNPEYFLPVLVQAVGQSQAPDR